ncbi:4-vinyl reductase [Candidatus Oscillochloris fontis]|uniref:4-vinyl reductase n=1 Tax=Candidatus Oscillochloris fontis TaxID=2496868 RepID=UPI00101CAB21|nr:4-vinyl reductase [Candidatus Oscillochloris fontis]
MTANNRQILGPFMNLVCFQYLRNTTEDVAGRAPIIAAGRKRGYDVIVSLGLVGKMSDAAEIQEKLNGALGVEGTRLCIVEQITTLPDGGYEVHIIESACTANQHASEPLCAFTLGVFIGAIHALTGVRMSGKELECQACGAPQCVYQITPI